MGENWKKANDIARNNGNIKINLVLSMLINAAR